MILVSKGSADAAILSMAMANTFLSTKRRLKAQPQLEVGVIRMD